jgi:mono/diheme cytochrome c family protein
MKKITTYTLTIISALGVALLSSCHDNKSTGYEFMPDMYRSPAYTAYEGSPLTSDSISALAPVAGTVSRSQMMLFNYPNTPEAYELAGAELKNPLTATAENLAEGQRLFTNMCQHCHGATGDGKGSLNITSKGGGPFPVPSYYDDAHKDLPDGKMFFSITHGKNLMGPHAPQVTQEERWKIILYINKLQDDALAAAAPASTVATAAATDTTKAN